jgi:RNA polymerase sigma factor (TIGR02999 family)
MAEDLTQRVTVVLRRVADGHPSATHELLPLVYDELRRLAQNNLAQQSPGHTLQATALVHEAYLRLVGRDDVAWQSRAHFFAVAAKAMRQILSNHARDKRAQKRSGDRLRVTLNEAVAESGSNDWDLLELHDALEKLTELDPLQSQLVELRFFAGMTVEEIALVMNSSPATIKREWRAARAWLNAELGHAGFA